MLRSLVVSLAMAVLAGGPTGPLAVNAQLYEASLATIPYFATPINATNPPSCSTAFMTAFSNSIWAWVHGLCEFSLRSNDFTLSSFTQSDAPYHRYLKQLATANDEERRRLQSGIVDCKTCRVPGCNVWCSPQFCKTCPTDDDRRELLRASSASSSKRRQRHSSEYPSHHRELLVTTDYVLLAMKISEILTGEAREFLMTYSASDYACMGVAQALQIDFSFISYI